MQSTRALSQNAARQTESVRGSPCDARGLRQDNDDTSWARQRTPSPETASAVLQRHRPRAPRSDGGRFLGEAVGGEICDVLRLRGAPVSVRRALQIHYKKARVQETGPSAATAIPALGADSPSRNGPR